MVKLYMVRHGRQTAGFGESLDPGLDDLGRTQAQAVAKVLAPLGPLMILSSPLTRTRETAMPLSKIWKREPVLVGAVAEVPAPAGLTLAGRSEWLGGFLASRWPDVAPDLNAWRHRVVEKLLGIQEDSVIFSHFVAINAAFAHAMNDERIMAFSPTHTSVTIFETDGKQLHVLEKGEEAPLARITVN
jgi:broad specificity phosphatase PhoE